jgi:hypothetical protein
MRMESAPKDFQTQQILSPWSRTGRCRDSASSEFLVAGEKTSRPSLAKLLVATGSTPTDFETQRVLSSRFVRRISVDEDFECQPWLSSRCFVWTCAHGHSPKHPVLTAAGVVRMANICGPPSFDGLSGGALALASLEVFGRPG